MEGVDTVEEKENGERWMDGERGAFGSDSTSTQNLWIINRAAGGAVIEISWIVGLELACD